jgi:hypothetical protein
LKGGGYEDGRVTPNPFLKGTKDLSKNGSLLLAGKEKRVVF